jgi:hypothetical protein
MTKAAAWTLTEEMRRDDFLKIVTTMVGMGGGIGTAGALLARKSDDVAYRVQSRFLKPW